MKAAIFASLAICVISADSATAQGLPQYVKGPLSGFEYECAQEKQRFDAKAFVSAIDLDGDGKPDYIFDISKGCAASKALYCTETEGCLIDVFLSGTEMKQIGLKVRSFRSGKKAGKTALLLTVAGTACGKSVSPCNRALVWNASDLVLE